MGMRVVKSKGLRAGGEKVSGEMILTTLAVAFASLLSGTGAVANRAGAFDGGPAQQLQPLLQHVDWHP